MPTLVPSQIVLIPCVVTDGMFSNEAAVEITVSGQSISLFVDRSLIQERGGKTFLKVSFVGENGKPENRTILLPSESFETGSRWLSVPKSVLQAA